jgi:large subunit ribosomal protein L49
MARVTHCLLMAHSARFLKRVKGHPRLWPNTPELIIPAPTIPTKPVSVLPSGWASPRGADISIPFSVTRTSIGQQVPVYTDYKNGRSRMITIIRKVTGNVDALVEELRRITGGAEVTARLGRVEIEGDRAKEVKTWLMSIGF